MCQNDIHHPYKVTMFYVCKGARRHKLLLSTTASREPLVIGFLALLLPLITEGTVKQRSRSSVYEPLAESSSSFSEPSGSVTRLPSTLRRAILTVVKPDEW